MLYSKKTVLLASALLESLRVDLPAELLQHFDDTPMEHSLRALSEEAWEGMRETDDCPLQMKEDLKTLL